MCRFKATPYTVTSYRKEICPQGLSKEGENDRPNRTDQNVDDLERLWTCVCQRQFATERGMKIHRTKKGCLKVLENCSANARKADDVAPQVDNHSGCEINTQPPEVHQKEEVEKIAWPKMSDKDSWKDLDDYASTAIRSALCGSAKNKARQLPKILYSVCIERLGSVAKKTGDPKTKQANRRQVEKGRLRKQQRDLKKQLRCCSEQGREGIVVLMDSIRDKIKELVRAEASRKRRRERRRKRERFLKNPYGFAKGLFEQGKTGELQASKEEVEQHLAMVYGQAREVDISSMPVLQHPTCPGCDFEDGELRPEEVERVVKKARSKSAPGMNGISYKVYKKCPQVLSLLTRILGRLWMQGEVPEEWCMANGVYIPKQDKAKRLEEFRPISLLNVEGKIFFSVLANRLTEYLLQNGYINTSIQKAGVPGFPGCLEHVSMIWAAIREAGSHKGNLDVIWLDLANAYGSVPHQIIDYAMEHFWVPEQLRRVISKYYQGFKMRFSVQQFTTGWQSLAVGIPMGCAISPLLFVLAMEMVIRGAGKFVDGLEPAKNQALPAMRAFMDDITIITGVEKQARVALEKLQELIGWFQMKFKPAKSRSLSLRKGKAAPINFFIGEERIPTLNEQPVKSLGRWYKLPLTDRFMGAQVKEELKVGLGAIEGCGLPGKYKAWVYQFALMPRIQWPLLVYDIPLSPVMRMEQMVNVKLRKWLGVPRSFNTNALYANSFAVSLPLTSLSEEYKVGKTRLSMMLRESCDPIIRDHAPDLNTGRRWDVNKELGDAMFKLEIKEITGAVQTGRHGIGWSKHVWFSKATCEERRKLVADEVKSTEEERRQAQSVSQAQQGRWSAWEDVNQRKLKWSDIWSMESSRLSFLLNSVYDQLPSPVNLVRWKLTTSDQCAECSSRGTLKHILCGCAKGLRRYTWRHNQVLRCLEKICVDAVSRADSGEAAQPVVRGVARRGFGMGEGWKIITDLDRQMRVPQVIVLTRQRPDLILFSEKQKETIMMELTVPWEENMTWAHERKLDRYEDLRMDCAGRGWRCEVFAVEVGCRGFLGKSAVKFLERIGLTSKHLRTAQKEIGQEAEAASAWIWEQHCLRKQQGGVDGT